LSWRTRWQRSKKVSAAGSVGGEKAKAKRVGRSPGYPAVNLQSRSRKAAASIEEEGAANFAVLMKDMGLR
jgi:hypothetical protein